MKNSTIELILERRSVRHFQNKPISDDLIMQIVNCGMFAPSARDRQNWHFTVVTNPNTIEEINRLTLLGMERLGIEKEEGYHVFYHAPLVIVLSSIIEGYSEINAGCAIENMALAAKALGLDSCIIGQTRYMYHQANIVDINRLLKIPLGYEHDLSICFGYSEGDYPEAKPRKDNLVDYIK
ncbi:MAG: nitroreductase family protein [Candidatus Izemoplasmatales bacterium]|nr:nitroreductase family protein [Candidatus Izemoplasmatales bacterium]